MKDCRSKKFRLVFKGDSSVKICYKSLYEFSPFDHKKLQKPVRESRINVIMLFHGASVHNIACIGNGS